MDSGAGSSADVAGATLGGPVPADGAFGGAGAAADGASHDGQAKAQAAS
jgi:hypothetical protein